MTNFNESGRKLSAAFAVAVLCAIGSSAFARSTYQYSNEQLAKDTAEKWSVIMVLDRSSQKSEVSVYVDGAFTGNLPVVAGDAPAGRFAVESMRDADYTVNFENKIQLQSEEMMDLVAGNLNDTLLVVHDGSPNLVVPVVEANLSAQSSATEFSARRRHHSRARRGGGGGGGTSGGAVWPVFMSALSSCKPGCQPYNYNVFRAQRSSCHGQGRAVDVGGIKCGGTTYSAYSGTFTELVSCCRSKGMTVLHRNGRGTTKGHHDHGHFSIGCSIPGHPNYW